MKQAMKIIGTLGGILVHALLIGTELEFNMETFSSANRNFKLTIPGGPHVLRVGRNKEVLGIDRLKEIIFYKTAESIGLAPELIAYNVNEQIMISKYVENHNSYERIHERTMIEKIIDSLLLLQCLY